MIRAAIDVGSNSLLMVTAERTPDGWRTLAETSAVTGLGRGTKTSGLLAEPGFGDTLRALREAYDAARAAGAEEIRAAGTMALRIARNAPEFLAAAAAQGTPLEVISGEREAELGFLAVAHDPRFAGQDRLSVIDTGGHSTELVTAQRAGSGWEVLLRKSVPIGALGLRERSLASPSPGFRERLAAVREIDDAIGLEYLPHQAGAAVALGATPCNLVSIRGRMATWQPEAVHGQELDFEEVSKAAAALCDLDDAGRAALVGIEPGREFTLHAGALMLERFLQAIHVLGCVVSVRGWRHGLLEE